MTEPESPPREPPPADPPASPEALEATVEPVETAIEPVDTAAEPAAPAGAPVDTVPTDPPVESTRRLIGASFDLLSRATEEMRRASFYIGVILLGTVGPLALATWAIEVGTLHRTIGQNDALLQGPMGAWYGLLAVMAAFGILVVAIESRAMAVAILGARLIGRPLTLHQAIARSRMVFWRAFAVGVIAAIPVTIAQSLIETAIQQAVPTQGEATVIATVVVAALIGAPLAYLMAGVVLGDVRAIEALRRSFRVFGARKGSAILVALFEVAAALLILFGLSAGLDIAYRLFEALGLGSDSGPAGLLLVTAGIAAVTFALGTLIFTVTTISIAPQVVMFVGLTHATMGLDHVRPGRDHDPESRDREHPRFRVITRPLWVGILVAWMALAILAAIVL